MLAKSNESHWVAAINSVEWSSKLRFQTIETQNTEMAKTFATDVRAKRET